MQRRGLWCQIITTETTARASRRVSTDPITILNNEVQFFCFGRDYQSSVAARVHPLMHRLLQTLNNWALLAAHLSRQTNSFISSYATWFCATGSSERGRGSEAFSPPTWLGGSFLGGRKGKPNRSINESFAGLSRVQTKMDVLSSSHCQRALQFVDPNLFFPHKYLRFIYWIWKGL